MIGNVLNLLGVSPTGSGSCRPDPARGRGPVCGGVSQAWCQEGWRLKWRRALCRGASRDADAVRRRSRQSGLVIIARRNDCTDDRRCRASSAAHGGFGWSVLNNGNGFRMAGGAIASPARRIYSSWMPCCGGTLTARRAGCAAGPGALGKRPWPTWRTATRASPGDRRSASRSRWARPILQLHCRTLPGAQPGGGADRAQAAALQHRNALPGDCARALFAPVTKFNAEGRRHRRPAALAAPGHTRGGLRHAAAGASRPQRAARGNHRDRHGG